MGITTVIRNPIWDTIALANAWFIRMRASDTTMSTQERAGVNFSVLLNSACFVEGSLESLLRRLLDARSRLFHSIDKPHFETRRAFYLFIGRLIDDLEERVCRATGPENYSEMFQLVLGKSLAECANDTASWEGIRVLFFLRNVIAHGRMAVIKHTMVRGTLRQPEWDEDFRGGYAKAAEYLQKRGLASGKFGDVDVETLVFNDRVADHFWNLAEAFTQAITTHVEADLAQTNPAKGARA